MMKPYFKYLKFEILRFASKKEGIRKIFYNKNENFLLSPLNRNEKVFILDLMIQLVSLFFLTLVIFMFVLYFFCFF